MTDPIADMLARIRNATIAHHARVEMPSSRLKVEIARILAEHLGKAEQGIEQLTLLLNLPEQPDAKRAEWLGLVAAWMYKRKIFIRI